MSQTHANAESELAEAVAALIGSPVAEVGADDNLIAAGLDSLAMMRLAGRLRRSGIDVGFADLVAEPTLRAWGRLIAEAKPGDAADFAAPVGPAIDEAAPFDLALMQHAYWVGRSEGQLLGGVAAHFYNEFDGAGVDPKRLEAAVRALLARHGMLRARILDDGRQQIPALSDWPGLRVHDLRSVPAHEAETELEGIRQRLSRRSMDIANGEVFDIQLSLLPDTLRPAGSRIHLGLDMIAADAQSLRVLLADLAALYTDPDTPLPPLGYSYPRYRAHLAALRSEPARGTAYQADRDYWQQRLAELPNAPRLPLADRASAADGPVIRRHRWLDAEAKRCLTDRSGRAGLTLAMTMAAVFADTLTAFSAEPRFLLNLPLFGREPLHPEVDALVGDFTSSVLLAWDGSAPGTFAERASGLQARFHADAAHAGYAGVEVLRDATRRHGEQVLAPVVYTSALGLGELFGPSVREAFGQPTWITSQGPQVWLDIQVSELDGGLLVNWDARDEVFPAGLLDAMFDAYNTLLDRLLADEDAWSAPVPELLPERQKAVRAKVNDTAAPRSGARLHDRFFAHAARDPHAIALCWGHGALMTYGELADRALRLAGVIREQGVGGGDLVAVHLPKGPEQIAAVLAVLAAGAAYSPIGIDQPAMRRERILDVAGVRMVLDADTVRSADASPSAGLEPGDASALAYVIFTSGSTGEPKGVEITHAAAMNTIDDVNERFGIGGRDRTLAVSALDFDLSVFDIFGPLSVGGAVVLIEEESRRDARRWLELVRRHRVTVWNTVPALLDMLLTVADAAEPPEPLRLALISGDWIGLDLPGRLAELRPGCRFIALGGATEAAIWSNAIEVHRVEPGWRSIPYGRPLRNQQYRVVDALGRDCPDWVPGELWIGGDGVAVGYRGAPELTAQRFVSDSGRRWYRTGDRGRYWPDGTLEFLGRTDHQVKIRGHRIELGEIETALQQHPAVGRAVALVGDDGRICAAVVGVSTLDTEDLSTFLKDRLPASMLPERFAALRELPLTANGKVDRAALGRLLAVRDTENQSSKAITPPAGEIEQRVARAWSEVLGVTEVGREHDFFALGGDSLIATRLLTRLRNDGFAHTKLADLFTHPALADFAATLTLDGSPRARRPVLAGDETNRLAPFPLTDVQRAYWLGRDESFTLGGVGCHFYREFDVVDLDVARLEAAVDRLVARHEMLRAVVSAQGEQRILPEVPNYRIQVTEGSFEDLREAASGQVFDPSIWPLFSIRGVRSGDITRLGIDIDNIALDALSILTFYNELGLLYRDLDAELPPVGMSFRDYVLSAAPEPAAVTAAQAYWDAMIPVLPPAPQLPLAADPATLHRPRFTRRDARIGPDRWRPIAEQARAHGLTPSAVLLTAFAEVLGRWSAAPELTLNLTLFDRKDVHPDIGKVLGDFTSLLLVSSRPQPDDRWLSRARRVQQELWAALDHRDYSAVRVLREMARRTGEAEPSMPVVFTSALGVGTPPSGLFAEPVWGVSQTPQVWLDHQATDTADGGVHLNWDIVEELFPDGLIDAMFDAYVRLVDWLARGDWDRPLPDLLPEAQREVRSAANDTAGQTRSRLLHGEFFRLAAEQPERVALCWGEDRSLTYGELAERALRLAAALVKQGLDPGEIVAVSLPKGPDQIAAVLGVLAAGAAYLPVGVDQPQARRERILRTAGARLVVDEHMVWPTDLPALPAPLPVADSDLAYVIFTSGSTGEPKGVEITHAAAVNTIDDVNERFGIGGDDRVLAVSALDFDLSVYDIFGPLSVGGAVVLIEEESRRDARRWLELVRRHRVTVWNTVPALLDMLLIVADAAEPPDPLRLVLVSGDWVGLDLPGRLAELRPGCRFIALGGATEAAIWSNVFEVDRVGPEWRSIPYGRPLRNQRFRVVDPLGRDCPDWVPGELWIGGAGVAVGYRGAPELTAQRFVMACGQRWYRTGDRGRYWPDGVLEFLGRTDQQVKIRGHRIELGEIEAALQSHPGVGQAIAAVVDDAAGRRLVAAVVPAVAVGPAPADVAAVPGPRPPEYEAEVVGAVLARLLKLDERADGSAIDVAEELRPLLELWLDWLAGQKAAGATARADTSADDAYRALIDRAQGRLLARLDDYREVLAGRLDPLVLLDDDVLSPSSLLDQDPGSALAVAELVFRLADTARAAGRTIEVAELGGRNGRTAEHLLRLLGPDQVRYTVLDSSAALIAAAEARLADLPHDTTCTVLPGTRIPDALRHRFDVVIAGNALHRYRDPAHGPALVSLLLRRGGTLLAVERSELTPLALLTAAVIERGYVDLDRERRTARSPMLPGARWAELFARAGLHDAEHRRLGGTVAELICARRPESAIDLHPDQLRAHAAVHLTTAMVPERIEILPWLPLSANGKVDRSALAAAPDAPAPADADEPPQGDLERELANLWAELLGRTTIGRRRGFFELGGDSLLATRFTEHVRQRYGVRLPLRRLFAAPALADVAASLAEELGAVAEMEEGLL